MLLHRFRFACEGRFFDAQIGFFDDAAVGGHDISRFEEDDIAGGEVAGGDFLGLAVAPHMDAGNGHLFEGGHGLLGAILLGETKGGVDDDDDEDDDGVGHLADKGGDDGRDDEDDDHHVAELVPEHGPNAFDSFFNQFVGAVLGEALGGLGRG